MLVHGRPLVYPDDAFGCWGTVSQSAVRPDSVVVAAPPLDQDLGLVQCGEDLAIEHLIPEPSIEALAIAVFPR